MSSEDSDKSPKNTAIRLRAVYKRSLNFRVIVLPQWLLKAGWKPYWQEAACVDGGNADCEITTWYYAGMCPGETLRGITPTLTQISRMAPGHYTGMCIVLMVIIYGQYVNIIGYSSLRQANAYPQLNTGLRKTWSYHPLLIIPAYAYKAHRHDMDNPIDIVARMQPIYVHFENPSFCIAYCLLKLYSVVQPLGIKVCERVFYFAHSISQYIKKNPIWLKKASCT